MEKRKIFLDKGFVAGCLVCCFGAGMAAAAGFSRGVYPLAVFVLMIAAGIFLTVEALRGKISGCLERISWKEPAMIALLFVSPVFAKTVGFYLSASVVIAGISWLTVPEKSVKAFVRVLLYSLFVAAAAYVIFTVLLKINTPKGILL